MACNGTQTGASAGTCAPVLDGQSTGECSSQSASSCGLDGTCNGAGLVLTMTQALSVVQQSVQAAISTTQEFATAVGRVSAHLWTEIVVSTIATPPEPAQPAIIRAAVILTVMLVSVRGATVKPISVSQESALVSRAQTMVNVGRVSVTMVSAVRPPAMVLATAVMVATPGSRVVCARL